MDKIRTNVKIKSKDQYGTPHIDQTSCYTTHSTIHGIGSPVDMCGADTLCAVTSYRLRDFGRSLERQGWHWYRVVIVIVCQVILALCTVVLYRDLIRWLLRVVLLRWCILRLSSEVVVFCRILVSFLAFPTLHFRLLEQATFLGKPLPLPTIFDFILSHQSFGRRSKDTLIFAELADPYVFFFGWVVVIVVFLLQATFTSCHSIALARWTSRFLGLLHRLLTHWRDSVLICLTCHGRACLCSLGTEAFLTLERLWVSRQRDWNWIMRGGSNMV